LAYFAFDRNVRNGSAIDGIVRGPNVTTQLNTYVVSEAVAVVEEQEEESEWPVTDTDTDVGWPPQPTYC
jgi:hypothetical protein